MTQDQDKKDSGRIMGLEKNVFYTGLTSFFTDTSSKMVYSVMPLFLLSLGASKTSISLIEGVAESTASLFKAFSGYWSDRIGRNKPFMVFGYGLTALLTPLYALVTAPFHVLLIRFAERVGKGVRTAPRDSLISGSVTGNNAGRNFGFHKAMDNSGAILGPLAASLLLIILPSDYSIIFLVSTIPALIGVFTIVAFIKEKKAVRNESNGRIHLAHLPKRFYLFLGIIFVFTMGNSADALLLVKTAETGIAKSMVPFVYMIFNTVSVFLAIPVGKVSDRIGREWLIISGFLVYSVVYFFFGKYNSIGIFIFLFIGYGTYSALADTGQKALISDLTGKNLRGTAYGLYHAVLGVTLLPASLVAGILYDRIGSNAPFYFGSAMAFLATVLMVVFTLGGGKKQPVSNIERLSPAGKVQA